MTKNRNMSDLTEDISVDRHIQDVENMAKLLLRFHEEREMTYEMSFAKRGLVGVWFNLARKYDRLDPTAEEYFQNNGRHSITLVDSLVDTAIYAMKWLALLHRLETLDDYDMGLTQWLTEVAAKELGQSVHELLHQLDFQNDAVEESDLADELRNMLQKAGVDTMEEYEAKVGRVTNNTKILRG